MLNWCDGITNLPAFDVDLMFTRTFQALEAAELLKTPAPLIKVINDRILSLFNNHVPHIQDMVSTYLCFPQGHIARGTIIEAYAGSLRSAKDIRVVKDSGHREFLKEVEDGEGSIEWIGKAVVEDRRKRLEICYEIEQDLFDLFGLDNIRTSKVAGLR